MALCISRHSKKSVPEKGKDSQKKKMYVAGSAQLTGIFFHYHRDAHEDFVECKFICRASKTGKLVPTSQPCVPLLSKTV